MTNPAAGGFPNGEEKDDALIASSGRALVVHKALGGPIW